MTYELAVLVPSRGRPFSISRLADAFHATSDGRAKLVIITDDDDPGYGRILDEPWIEHLVQPAAQLAPSLNRWAPIYAAEYPYVGSIGDDHLPRTRGWDSRVIEALAAVGTGIVYPDDMLQHEKIPTACFFTSNLIEALGGLTPPTFLHLNIDLYWKSLGEALGRLRYLPHVQIEHMHPAAGKGLQDSTYAASNSAEMVRADGLAYWNHMENGLADDVRRIQEECLCAS